MGKGYNEQEAYNRDVGFDMKIEYDANNNSIYIGRAYPGALVSEAKWQIYKMAYDASNNMTSLRWAKGGTTGQILKASDDFNKIWNDRAGYDFGDI